VSKPPADALAAERGVIPVLVTGIHISAGADMTVETPQVVADRIRRGLAHVPADRVVVAPDCGLKYLPREVAFSKMHAMVEGAAIVRRELAG